MKKLLSILLLVPAVAFAWEPTKPISAYVGFSAGSGNEVSFRILETAIAKNTGANFVINLKPGAGSAINNGLVATGTPDGYTVCLCSEPAIVATDRMVMPNKKHSVNTFVSTVPYAATPMTIVVAADDPINSIQDLVTALKTEKITVGDPGSAARLVYELLAANVKFVESNNHVVRAEYKGPADTLADVMGKHIRVGIMPLLVSGQAHYAKKVKIIAITSQTTMPELPGVKTMSSVYPDFVFNLTWNLLLPDGTPKDVADWYTRTIVTALKNPEIRQKYSDNLMIVPAINNAQEYRQYLVKSEKKFESLVDKVLAQQQAR